MSKEIDAAVDAALDAYEQQFGDGFPSMEVQTTTNEELLKAIKRCLDAGQPAKVVFGLKYDDKDLKY